jgi:hypothetical protein
MNFRNTFLVMRQEIFATLRRWGFVIFAFVLPILLGVIAIVIAAFNNRPGADPGEEEVADTTGLQGFVGFSFLPYSLEVSTRSGIS